MTAALASPLLLAASLALSSPEAGDYFRLARIAYDDDRSYQTTVVTNWPSSGENRWDVPRAATLAWNSAVPGETYDLELVPERGPRKVILKGLEGPKAALRNLPVNEVCRWRVVAHRPDGTSATLTGGVFRTENNIRWIDAKGARNVRDIGGWNGLKQGLVFRGTELNAVGGRMLEIRPEGAYVLTNDLGVVTDLDLRRPTARERGAFVDRSPLGGSVRYMSRPIPGDMGVFADAAAYRDALRVFADPANYPIYMHCRGGADRTGALAWILEGLCGASEVDLSIDFEATSFACVNYRTRMNGFPWGHCRYADMVARIKTYPGEMLKDKFAAYCRQALGLTEAEIASIRSILEEPRFGTARAREVRTRDGVGNVLAKLRAGGDVAVAYLGGSITAMPGWRNKTTDWLRASYPNARVREIHAAIGGTGSDLGVFRAGRDALDARPDLMFVEFATNDRKRDTWEIWRSMEGIVRQAWTRNPKMDVVFAYTICSVMTNEYLRGECIRSASAMEALADHYGVPSVCFGPRVCDEIRAGRLVMSRGEVETAVPPSTANRDKAIAERLAAEGRTLFSNDGVHPADPGHELYLKSVVAAFAAMDGIGPVDHGFRLSKPFVFDHLAAARMVSVSRDMLKGSWRRLDEPGAANSRRLDVGRFAGRMGSLWEGDTPGDTLRFRFRGTACSVYDLLGPDAAQVLVKVDGKPLPEPVPRFDKYCTYYRLALLPVFDGPDGVHEVEISVDSTQPSRRAIAFRFADPDVELSKPRYDGTGFWPGALMVVGEIVREEGDTGRGLFVGTAGRGHVSPAAASPFGAVQAGPDTSSDSAHYVGDWPHTCGYQHADRYLWRFSQNRFYGIGCGSMGLVGLLPSVRPFAASDSTWSAEMDKSTERAEPGFYGVTLVGGIGCEAAALPHTAAYRFRFPKGRRAYLLVDADWGVLNVNPADGWRGCFGRRVIDGAVELSEPSLALVHCRQVSWNDIEGWAALRFSSPVVGSRLLRPSDHERGETWEYDFGELPGGELEVRLGLSSTSILGAERNLDAEMPSFGFGPIRRRAGERWAGLLGRIRLDDGCDPAVRANFEAAYYRTLIHPSDIGDVGARAYSNMSLWDIFRACAPLHTIVCPEVSAAYAESMLGIYERQGYLPILHNWGNDNHCMVGHHAVPIVVDNVLKGNLGPVGGVLVARLYEAVRDSLTRRHVKASDGTWGLLKEDWDILDRYGYYPFDKMRGGFRGKVVKGESVSRTLECAYDDACAARFAQAVGKADDAAFFSKRAANWRNVFDASSGFMRGRDSAGRWREPFDPKSCGAGPWAENDFTEGNSWQYTWHVMHDVPGLVAAMGGAVAFGERLQALFEESSEVYGTSFLHDVSGLVGQYAHGNEPSHHVAYLFRFSDRPRLTDFYVRKICRQMYRPEPDGLCGNDDAGQMAAWYVFSSLGFYPVDPCGGEYVVGAPQVPGATISLPGGKTFRIRANGLSEANMYVKSVCLNGRPVDGWKIRHSDIMSGGELVFEMEGGEL